MDVQDLIGSECDIQDEDEVYGDLGDDIIPQERMTPKLYAEYDAAMCDIADEQAALQAAWDELQATPSYVERFDKEEDKVS